MPLALNQIVPAVILLAAAGLAIGMLAEVMDEIQDTEGTDTTSGLYNATVETLNAFNTIAGFMPVIGVVVIAAVVIGLIYMFR